MLKRRNVGWLASMAVVIAVSGALVAGCGDDDDDGGSATQAPATATRAASTAAATIASDETPQASGEATVEVAQNATLGAILVDSRGFTLYTFANDTPGSGDSACTGGCVNAWPPLTVTTAPSGGDGVTGELATIERDDGAMQVTYNGSPLYFFASDTAPGDAKGQGVGNIWFAATP
jgi:predicted lipoprotein with Yx(FWY)xxD motif